MDGPLILGKTYCYDHDYPSQYNFYSYRLPNFVDLTQDSKSSLLPSIEQVAACLHEALHKASWQDATTPAPANERTEGRMAWTKFVTRLCRLPYLHQFAHTEAMTDLEKTRKSNACAHMAHLVYGVLWHCRFIFPGVPQKTLKQGNDITPPNPNSNQWVLSDLARELSYGIRRVASSRRRKVKNEVSLTTCVHCVETCTLCVQTCTLCVQTCTLCLF